MGSYLVFLFHAARQSKHQKRWKKYKEEFPLEADPNNTDQLTFTSHCLVDGISFRGLLSLSQLDLSRVGGEEEHDGEACQEAGVLDGESDQEASAACILFFPTHLIHFWKLSRTKTREINASVSDVFLTALIKKANSSHFHHYNISNLTVYDCTY